MGRKIKDYPLDTNVSGGDRLIGSDEHGATKNFGFYTLVDTTIKTLGTNLEPGWLFAATEEGIEEAFLRTDSVRVDNSPLLFTITASQEIEITDEFLAVLTQNSRDGKPQDGLGSRVIISNASKRFLSTIATINGNYITLTDTLTDTDVNDFTGSSVGYDHANTRVTGFTNPVTTVVGDFEADNFRSITEEEIAAIAANSLKVGITPNEQEAIVTNTAKADVKPDNILNIINLAPEGDTIRPSLIPDLSLGELIVYNGDTLAQFRTDWAAGDDTDFPVAQDGVTLNTGDLVLIDADETPTTHVYTGPSNVFGSGVVVLDDFSDVALVDISGKVDKATIDNSVIVPLLGGGDVYSQLTVNSQGLVTAAATRTLDHTSVGALADTTVTISPSEQTAIVDNTAKIGVTPVTVKTAIGSGTAATDYLGNDGTWRAIPGGESTEIFGSPDEIDVSQQEGIFTISLDNVITDAIAANTLKTGITTAEQLAIVANTAKVGITTAEVNKLGFISVTQAVDLDTVVTDISTNTTNIATNATNISTNATNIATNVTGISDNATDISTNVTDIDSIETKTDLITVTKPIDLDDVVTDFVVDYDDIPNRPIQRKRTVETIVLGGTRTNLQTPLPGVNVFSTITLLDSFAASPGLPVVVTAGSGGHSERLSNVAYSEIPDTGTYRIASITEENGTIHYGTIGVRSSGGYITNGFDVGLEGILAIGETVDANSTTATYAVRQLIDFGTTQTLQVTGDVTSEISVGDILSEGTRFGRVNSISYTSPRTFISVTTINSQYNGIVGETINFGRSSTLQVVPTTLASFTYDPDLGNEVYNVAAVNVPFSDGGGDIDTSLTNIGTTIAGLDSNITWDGNITKYPSTTTIVDTGATQYRDFNGISTTQWTMFIGTSIDLVPLPKIGDDWTTLNNVRIFNVSSNRLSSNVSVGDLIKFTFGSGSARFPVTRVSSHATTIGEARDIVGTIGLDFSDLANIPLTVDVTTQAKSSITIGLGTTTNIESTLSIVNGLNNMENVFNSDGAPSSGNTPSTTITVIDGTGREVTSFTSGVQSATDNNVDLIGQRIADSINANTETPIDFNAEYSIIDNAVILTAQRAGITLPWTIDINNNGVTSSDVGDLTISDQFQSEIVVNEIETLELEGPLTFPDGSTLQSGAVLYDNVVDAPIRREKQVDVFTLSGNRANVSVGSSNETSTITMLNSFDTAPQPYTISLNDFNENSLVLASDFPNTWVAPYYAEVFSVFSGGTPEPFSGIGQREITLTTTWGEFMTDIFSTYDGQTIDGLTYGYDSVTGARTIAGFTEAPLGTVSTLIRFTESGNNSLSFTGYLFSDFLLGGDTGSSFSYDPDLLNTVYPNQIDDLPFTTVGVNITNHMTQIANAIAALNDNITWDGVITDIGGTTDLLPAGAGTTYAASTNVPAWYFANNLFTGLTFPDGTTWASSGIQILIIAGNFTNVQLPAVGETVRLTLPNGSWVEWLRTSSDSIGASAAILRIDSITDSSGTISGLSSFGTATQAGFSVVEDLSSSITIDLGTGTNLNSSFSLTGGGNNTEMLLNQNGTDGTTPSTTITLRDGNDNEVTSFTSSVTTTSISNIDEIGTSLATAVNNNNETPIDFTGSYDSSTKELTLTALTSGTHDDWSIVINNNDASIANEGDLGVSGPIEMNEQVNEVDIISFPDGTSQTTGFDPTSETTFADGINVENIVSNNDMTIESDVHTFINVGDSLDAFIALQLADRVNFIAFPSQSVLNAGYDDIDFNLRKLTSGVAINYDAGDDTIDLNATIFSLSINATAPNILQIYDDFGAGGDTIFNSNRFTVNGAGFTVNDFNDRNVMASGLNDITFNNDSVDRDFIVKKNTSGDAFAYDAGLDQLDIGTSIVDITSGSTRLLMGSLSGLSTIFSAPVLYIRSGSEEVMTSDSLATTFNSNQDDRDFVIRKETSGTVLNYDAGTDNLALDAATATLNGNDIADSETGTWTPVFNTAGGTVGTTNATYSRTGKSVTVTLGVVVGITTSTLALAIQESSLPFSIPSTGNRTAVGTYYTSDNGTSTNTSNSGSCVAASSAIIFMDNSTNSYLRGTDNRGYLGLTITYITED